MQLKFKRLAVLVMSSALLAGCSSWQIKQADRKEVVAVSKPSLPLPQQWHASVAHGGSPQKLAQWWSQANDPVLQALIVRAQEVNPQMELAVVRIRAARAQLTIAGARLDPSVDASAGAQRGRATAAPVATQVLGGIDANWELDLFGAGRAGQLAAEQRIKAREADWHDARITLAAEVALLYINLRACESQLDTVALQSASLTNTLSLTEQRIRAGFQAPADASLLKAAHAQTKDSAAALASDCSVLVKTLSAVTASDESNLRTQLTQGRSRLPVMPAFDVQQVPADLLMQRADIASIANEMSAAYAEVGVAKGNTLPRISLGGSLGAFVFRSGGQTSDGLSWSFGPSVYLPLFNRQRLHAQVDLAQSRQDELLAQLKLKLALAVRDVEESLVRLQASTERRQWVQEQNQHQERYIRAVQDKYKAGLGTLMELEDARRNLLSAQLQQVAVERERLIAWVNLYKALGGGFNTEESK